MAESKPKARSRSPVKSPAADPIGRVVDRTPPLEWVAAACGATVALGAIGYLGWEGLQPHHETPSVVASTGPITASPSGYVVAVRVENQSRATAAAVELEGTLTLPHGETETGAITFDYLPGRGHREGGLSFRHDPRAGALTLTVKGYVEP